MVFIVADIGVNWDGNFDIAEEIMINVKNIGCDAVKFQSFSEDIVKEHPQKSRLLKSSITSSNIEKIDKLSNSVGIEWFATPMYPQAVKLLDQYVRRYKVRTFDGELLLKSESAALTNEIFDTGKDVIISVQSDPSKSKFYQNKKIHWLYCVPKYPCQLHDIDFTKLKNFDGYSNHCLDIIAPLSAVILGAKIIEVHVTADKSKDFIDNSVSLDYKQLSELVKLIRSAEKIRR